MKKSSKKRGNISIFVPHAGCPHTCSFCNQRTITGSGKIPTGNDTAEIVKKALEEYENPEETEIAFFGGSFTAIDRKYMLELLTCVQPFIGKNKFHGIRISTRPDCIDREILDILKKYNVTSIELGAQSMSEKVLLANERGHTAKQVENACGLIREYGCFELGLQMMVGLYKSSEEDEIFTFRKICELAPDTLRIYPVAILEGTKLGELYKSGEYKTMEFDRVVDLCCDFLTEAEKRGIKVIKLGLHSSEDVEKNLLGGFYHPAFREICQSVIYRRQLEEKIKEAGNPSEVEFVVAEKNLSKALGQKKSNIRYFKEQGIDVKITACKNFEKDFEMKI